jgi:hypothetical protein
LGEGSRIIGGREPPASARFSARQGSQLIVRLAVATHHLRAENPNSEIEDRPWRTRIPEEGKSEARNQNPRINDRMTKIRMKSGNSSTACGFAARPTQPASPLFNSNRRRHCKLPTPRLHFAMPADDRLAVSVKNRGSGGQITAPQTRHSVRSM